MSDTRLEAMADDAADAIAKLAEALPDGVQFVVVLCGGGGLTVISTLKQEETVSALKRGANKIESGEIQDATSDMEN